MALACDTDDLADASFRGVPFFVDKDEGSFGRRVVVHEYPMKDDAFLEDLGKSNRAFSVTAYVSGPGEGGQKDALVAACEQNGAGMLILPAEQPFMARLITAKVTRSKDKLGWFDIQMEFKADTGQSSGLTVTSNFERLLNTAIGDLVAPFSALFDAAFSAESVLDFVTDNAVGRLQDFASSLSDAVQANASATVAPVLIAQTTDLVVNADVYVKPGDNSPQSPSDIVSIACGIFQTLTDSLDAGTALAVLLPFCSFSVAEDPAQSQSISDTQDAVNASVFCTFVRSVGLTAYAQAASAYNYPTRAQAIQARADIAELFDQQIDNVMPDLATTQVLQKARDYGVKALTTQIVTLVPVVIVTAPRSMPSLYWASRLYDDATRATELVDRNDVANPAFMPQEFEALSS